MKEQRYTSVMITSMTKLSLFWEICQSLHVKQTSRGSLLRSPEECMMKIADTINRAHKETSGVCVVLENVAGGVRPCLFPPSMHLEEFSALRCTFRAAQGAV